MKNEQKTYMNYDSDLVPTRLNNNDVGFTCKGITVNNLKVILPFRLGVNI